MSADWLFFTCASTPGLSYSWSAPYSYGPTHDLQQYILDLEREGDRLERQIERARNALK